MSGFSPPLHARDTLFALGAVDGPRARRPVDPVAAWLLLQAPALAPPDSARSALAACRARADVVDGCVDEAIWAARDAGRQLTYWSLGAGFDARWYRVLALHGDVVQQVTEVDEPALLSLKHALLDDSTYRRAWLRVTRRAAAPTAWAESVDAEAGALVVLEGAAARLGERALLALLRTLRHRVPGVRVVLDLWGADGTTAPPPPPGTRGPWVAMAASPAGRLPDAAFAGLGYRVTGAVCLAGRPELRAATGAQVCPGVAAVRVLTLVGDRPLPANG